jgi:hypothetical protein
MAASQVSVGGAIRYALSLLSSNWRAVWGVLALNALAATVSAAGGFGSNPSLALAAVPASLMTTLMLNGALYRLAFADRHPNDPAFQIGHHGLQWGRHELRLLAASLLVLVFVAVIVLIAVIAIGSVLIGLEWAGALRMPDPKAIMAMIYAPRGAPDPAVIVPVVVLMALVVYLSGRLTLAMPATVDQQAIRVLRTWRLTKGHVWKIIASILFVALPVIILNRYVTGNLISPDGMRSDAGPTAILLASLVQGLADGLFLAPMAAGISAYFYRALSQAAPVEEGPR